MWSSNVTGSASLESPYRELLAEFFGWMDLQGLSMNDTLKFHR